MKVNMIMCVIMVITNCFIPILYYGFVHGCCSWTAKQANCSKPQSLYTSLSLWPHCPPAHIVSRNASWQVTPVASRSGSLRILLIILLTLTRFIMAESFWQRTILKWPPEVNSLSITLPVHGFGVLYVRYSSCYLLIQRILWGWTAWCGLIICSSCPVPPGQSTGYQTPPVSPEGQHSGGWITMLPCP